MDGSTSQELRRERTASRKERSEELFRRLPGDDGARDALFELHLPLAEYLARRFGKNRSLVDDLTQVAGMALLNAIDRFDPHRGVQFTTFATPTIVGELKRFLRDNAWSLRVPRTLQETALEVSAATWHLEQELGRSPRVTEIAERTGYSDEDVVEAMETTNAYTVASLDAPSFTGEALERQVGIDDHALSVVEDRVALGPAMRRLSDRDRRIVYLRFFRGQTQAEIATDLGLSQMHVSRLLREIMRTLRESMEAAAAGEPDKTSGPAS